MAAGFRSPSPPPLRLLPLLFLVLDCLLLVLFSVPSRGEYACSNSKPEYCGVLNISYPFWKSSDSPPINNSYCGYQGFRVTCEPPSTPILQLGDSHYRVLNIDYKVGVFSLAHDEIVDLGSDDCPRDLHNVTLSSDVSLSYANNDVNITFFFNCTDDGDSQNNSISCLDHDNNYVFGENQEYVPRNCSEILVLTVLRSNLPDPSRLGIEYAKALRGGFELNWSGDANRHCADCERSGGRCGFNNSAPACFCSDGKIEESQCRGRKQNKGLIIGSVVAMPPKRIPHPPALPPPVDDTSSTVRPIRRETRGTHSDRLRRQIEERGRLSITFRKSDGRPIGPNAAAFMTELGVSVRKFASLQAKTWKQVPADNKRMIYERLSAAFDISFEEDTTSVRKETERLMGARYRDNRNKMHIHYKSLLHLPPPERRHHIPIESCESQEDWDYMCDLFESEKFQTRSATNVQNRSQLPYNHRGGSRSFVQYSYDGTDQSQRKDRITVFNTTHCSSSKGWIGGTAEASYGDMVRLRDEHIQSQETGDDIDAVQIADQICDQVLGVRSGYIRGLGSGPKPVRSTSSDAATSSSRATTALLREELATTRAELATTKDKLATTEGKLATTEVKLTSMQSRQDMFEAILNRLAPGALESMIQASSSSSAPPSPPPS